MQRLRHIAVWALLATFVVGGAVGPVAHQTQHAVEQASASAHSHTSADGPVWCGESVAGVAPDCVLCTTRLVIVPPAEARADAPHELATAWDATRAHLTSSNVVAAPLIRGPPTLG